jgi:divalent metal cation (Fe/Co/Zn/Cd) transporter
MTDVVFNIFSIIFPLGMSSTPSTHLGQSLLIYQVGFYAQLWWLDALGGLLLSMFVIFNWAQTSAGHIRNLTGAAATADERNGTFNSRSMLPPPLFLNISGIIYSLGMSCLGSDS